MDVWTFYPQVSMECLFGQRVLLCTLGSSREFDPVHSEKRLKLRYVCIMICESHLSPKVDVMQMLTRFWSVEEVAFTMLGGLRG